MLRITGHPRPAASIPEKIRHLDPSGQMQGEDAIRPALADPVAIDVEHLTDEFEAVQSGSRVKVDFRTAFDQEFGELELLRCRAIDAMLQCRAASQQSQVQQANQRPCRSRR